MYLSHGKTEVMKVKHYLMTMCRLTNTPPTKRNARRSGSRGSNVSSTNLHVFKMNSETGEYVGQRVLSKNSHHYFCRSKYYIRAYACSFLSISTFVNCWIIPCISDCIWRYVPRISCWLIGADDCVDVMIVCALDNILTLGFGGRVWADEDERWFLSPFDGPVCENSR